MEKENTLNWIETRLSTTFNKIDDSKYWIKVGSEEMFLYFEKDSVKIEFDGHEWKSKTFNEFKTHVEDVIEELLGIYPTAMIGKQYKVKNV